MDEFSTRQKQIIDTSIKIIAKKGIQQLTIKNISKSIKISEPAIYRHFDSKMDILIAILSQFKNAGQIATSSIIFENTSSIKQFETLYTHQLKTFSNNPAIASVIFSEEIFQNEKRLSEMVNSIMQANQTIIMKIIESGQERSEIRKDIPSEQIGVIIMGALRLLVTKWRLSKYSFNLQEEGTLLFSSIKILIEK